MSQKLKFTMAITLILVAFSYLMFNGFNNAKGYYMTIDEVNANVKPNDPIYDNNMKVNGKLIGKSVKWEPSKVELRFDLRSEKGEVMHVFYKGVKPDNFNDDIEVIVEGKYTVERVFVAEKLMTKCPSKYEEQKEK